MKLEQKEATRSLDERTQKVAAAMTALSHMKDFPATDTGLLAVAKAIARFAQTVEVNHVFEESSAKGFGWVVPIDWLIEEVVNTCVFFPAPIQLRRIYESRFTPLDGRYSTSMQAVAEN